MSIGSGFICVGCVRFQPWWTAPHGIEKAHCAAFPDGIPDDIIYGGFDHRQPHEGDHGIRFLSNGEPLPPMFNAPKGDS
jgi:hypothetical protein